ncbi:MAG: helicase-related protein [Candidatus Uhrbacteria bacterium]
MAQRKNDGYTGDILAWANVRPEICAWTPPTFRVLNRDVVEIRPYVVPAFDAWETLGNFGIIADTASGKTYMAYMLADQVLAHDGRILINAPTTLLLAQHAALARKAFRIAPEDVRLISGRWTPKRRSREWPEGRILIATPQTTANDIERGILDPKTIELAILDESHHASRTHAFIRVANAVHSADGRILALTASPGGTSERIERVRTNLHLNAWIRIADSATSTFRPPVHSERVPVALPLDARMAVQCLEDVLERLTTVLADAGLLEKPSRAPSPAVLSKVLARIDTEGLRELLSYAAGAMSLTAALTSVVSDDYTVAYQRLTRAVEKRMKRKDGTVIGRTPVARRLRVTKEIRQALTILRALDNRKQLHPKQIATIEILERALQNGRNVRVLVYNCFADGAERLADILRDRLDAPVWLITGQQRMKAEETVARMHEFSEAPRGIIVATDVIREGVHAPFDELIEYTLPKNAISLIQLRGRTGRDMPGRIYSITTDHSYDLRYATSAPAAARRMRALIPAATIRSVSGDQIRRSYFSRQPAKDRRAFIAELCGAFVFERFAILHGEVVAKHGRKPYARFTIGDRTGIMPLLHWCPNGLQQAEQLVQDLRPGVVAIVAGMLDYSFKAPRVIINPRDGQHVTPCPSSDYLPEDYERHVPF